MSIPIALCTPLTYTFVVSSMPTSVNLATALPFCQRASTATLAVGTFFAYRSSGLQRHRTLNRIRATMSSRGPLCLIRDHSWRVMYPLLRISSTLLCKVRLHVSLCEISVMILGTNSSLHPPGYRCVSPHGNSTSFHD